MKQKQTKAKQTKLKPIKFKNEEDARKHLKEGFLGWDVLEVFDFLCAEMLTITDNLDSMFEKDKIEINLTELFESIQCGLEKEMRIASEIRKLWITGEFTEKQLSDLFNLSKDTIHTCVTNKNLFDAQYQEWIETEKVRKQRLKNIELEELNN